jgi:hypothetical protein
MPVLNEIEVETAICMAVIECNHEGCGVIFGMTKTFQDARRKDHKTWYCPNGHARHYPGESEEERLRRVLHETQLARERAEREKAAAQQAEQKQADARKKAERQLKNHVTRTANGTCPCCQRTFKQLAAHMKNKHPDYVEGAKV